MLIPGEKLLHQPVMSLQTGTELARTKLPLIDPRNLTVLAYQLEGNLLEGNASFLRVEDIREISNVGFIVDSSDEFVAVDDIIKLKEVNDFEFSLLGLSVIDEKKHKLGKVEGYILEAGSFYVQQVRIKRPLLRSLNDTELLVNRAQIISVSNDTMVVKDADAAPQAAIQQTVRSYANPFRGRGAQPESISRD